MRHAFLTVLACCPSTPRRVRMVHPQLVVNLCLLSALCLVLVLLHHGFRDFANGLLENGQAMEGVVAVCGSVVVPKGGKCLRNSDGPVLASRNVVGDGCVAVGGILRVCVCASSEEK